MNSLRSSYDAQPVHTAKNSNDLFEDEKNTPCPTQPASPQSKAATIHLPDEEDPYLVDWDESNKHDNPREWNSKYRHMLVIIVSLYTMQSPMTSSMNAPALDVIKTQFGVTSNIMGNMMMSIQVLAFAVGPIIFAPMSERFGRKNVMQLMNLVFLIFNMACGFSKTFTQMIVLRFFTGLAGAAPLSMSAGTVADLFGPEERGRAMATYTLAPVLGPCVGPMFAGWIIQGWGPSKWPWIFYFSSIYGAVIAVIGFILLRETYAPVLLDRKVQKLREKTGKEEWHTKFEKSEPFWKRFVHGMSRPAIFLFTQPAVFVPALYQSILFGCQYLLLAAFPMVFKDDYNMAPGIASLHYIPFLIGFMFFGQVGGRCVDIIYRRLKEKNNNYGIPEYKVPLLIVTGISMPVGLLIYGWSVQYHTHWIVPDIGIVFLAIGIRGALFICPLYLADSVPLYSASAVSAGVSLRCLFAFIFPLFSPPMYNVMGQGGGNTFLAGICALVGLPAPYLLFRYGERLRHRSKYSKEAMAVSD